MKRLVVLFCLYFVQASQAQWVPFEQPWDDVAESSIDLRPTIDRPAGAHGFVTARDGHLYVGAERLRLFGVNFTSSANMPDHASSEKIAAHLAKLGFNAVRCHFLDATWGDTRLINYESGDSRNWNTNALDCLDYFLSQLRNQGVYIDLNLLVGRKFGVGDGVDPRINTLPWKTAHAIGFFNASVLQSQQQYARQLLTHRNPYTGLAYVDDPAVALVEINNENGLIHTWMGGEFDKLGEPFASDLQQQWNAWLVRRYSSDAGLRQGWNVRDEPLGSELLKNGRFSDGLTDWSVEEHSTAHVATRTSNGSLTLCVLSTGTAGWHVQLAQAKVNVVSNAIYTLSFRARADASRSLEVYVMQTHLPWMPIGLSAEFKVSPEWQTFRYSFIANASENNARVSFTKMSQPNAEFQIADVSLRTGGCVGLLADESLSNRTVRLPKTYEDRTRTSQGSADWTRFLWETEHHYWQAMRNFLKQDLHVRAPVVGTIVGCSTPNLMADFDVVDTHAYWNHPRFPGAQWDQNNWVVPNESMVDHPDQATISYLSFCRIAGKPHLVSEYNHPAPNEHASEGPLFLAAYGAFQDWDGIFLYTYAHAEDGIKAGRIPGFFDVGQHPTILANVPAASLIFRRADVRPGHTAVLIPLPPEKELSLINNAGHAWQMLPFAHLGVAPSDALAHRIALTLTNAAENERSLSASVPSSTFKSDTSQLTWSLASTNSGLLTLITPRTVFAVGHADAKPLDFGDGLTACIGQTRNGWATLTLTTLAGDGLNLHPKRALLVVTGSAQNTDMIWKNDQHDSVGKNWGVAPSLVEPVAVSIHLPLLTGTHAPMVHAVDATGQIQDQIPVRVAPNGYDFDVGPAYATLWYVIDWP